MSEYRLRGVVHLFDGVAKTFSIGSTPVSYALVANAPAGLANGAVVRLRLLTSVDGAGRWQSFRYITVPHLFNLSVVLWILMTIWSVNDFETPYLLTGGGPSNATENLIILAHRYTFRRNDVGMGTATAFITLLILLALALGLLRRQRQTE